MQKTDPTFTVSEVAAIVGKPVETIKTWRKKHYFPIEERGGWRRFTLKELFGVMVFAEVSSSTVSYQFASMGAALAEQAFNEITRAEGVVPYLVGADSPEFGDLTELVYGVEQVSWQIGKLVGSNQNYGAYAVIDYASIFHRLLARLADKEDS